MSYRTNIYSRLSTNDLKQQMRARINYWTSFVEKCRRITKTYFFSKWGELFWIKFVQILHSQPFFLWDTILGFFFLITIRFSFRCGCKKGFLKNQLIVFLYKKERSDTVRMIMRCLVQIQQYLMQLQSSLTELNTMKQKKKQFSSVKQ